MINLERFFIGTDVIRVYIDECKTNLSNIERFINLCTNNGVHVLRIYETKENTLDFVIFHRELQAISNVADKCNMKIEIVKVKGLPGLLHKCLDNNFLIAGVLLSFLVIKICSLFIWDIDISGNNKYTDPALLECLEGWNIKNGTLKGSIDCNELEKQIRMTYDDISFVSARIEGEVLEIVIKEGIVYDGVKDEEGTSSMVSRVDGVIENIITRQGTPKVKAGDSVKEGDLLVSGIVEIKDDSAQVVAEEYVNADADIYIRYLFEKEFTFENTVMDKVYTGNVKKAKYIYYNGRKIFLYKPLKVYDYCDIMSSELCWEFVGRFEVPVITGTIYYYEYEQQELIYDEDTAREKADEILAAYREKLKSANILVNDYSYDLEINDDKVYVNARFDVTGKLTKNVKIEEAEKKEDKAEE